MKNKQLVIFERDNARKIIYLPVYLKIYVVITGILMDKTMADKLIYTPNVNSNTQNYLFCRLKLVVETFDTQLKKSTNQNSLKTKMLLSS